MVFLMEHQIIFLSSMDKENKNFNDVLNDAKKLGYAESQILLLI